MKGVEEQRQKAQEQDKAPKGGLEPVQEQALDDFKSPAEKHAAAVAVGFALAVPLVAFTQLLGLGYAGFVLAVILASVLVAVGPQAAARLPAFQQARESLANVDLGVLLYGVSAEEEENTENTIEGSIVTNEHASRSSLHEEREQEQEQAAPILRQATHVRRPVILAENLVIALRDIAGKAIFVVGLRRSGKTTLGALLAEQIGQYFIPMFIPDLEGDYLSLTEALPRVMIAGHPNAYRPNLEYAFVSIGTLEDARKLGFNILAEGLQIVLDMQSYKTVDEACAVATAIIKGLFDFAEQYPDDRCTCEVFLDEAQRFCPERLSESIIKNAEVLEDFFEVYRDLQGVGGKRGLAPVVLTQRFAQVNKKIMAQTEVMYILKQQLEVDKNRCMEYVKPSIASRDAIENFTQGQGVYIAYDNAQVVTHFAKRASSDKRSRTPDPEAAFKYAQLPSVQTGLNGIYNPNGRVTTPKPTPTLPPLPERAIPAQQQQKAYEPIPLPVSKQGSSVDKAAYEKIAAILRTQPELMRIGDARLAALLQERGYSEATRHRVNQVKNDLKAELGAEESAEEADDDEETI